MNENNNLRPFGLKDKIGYFMGDFGCTITFTLITSFMMIFYTQFIGISLLHYGIIILLTKIWDGINDPIIGAIADRLKPKNGDKFRPWIFWGSFPLAFAALLLFSNTSMAPYWVKITVCIVGYLIWDIAYTVVNVPYGAMNAVMTADTVERSQLSAWRNIGAFVGGVLIFVLLPQILYKTEELSDGSKVSAFQGERMFAIALVLGIIVFIAIQILHKLSIERIKHTAEESEKYSFFKTIKDCLTNRTIVAVSLSAFMYITFMMSSMTTGTLVFQIYFKNGALASFAILGSLSVLLFAPLVKRGVKKWGKRNLTSWPLLAGVGVSLVLYVMPEIPVLVWLIGHVILGFSMSFYALLSTALISDGVDTMELKTGKRNEGTVYAMYSLTRKLGQGVGQALIPLLIAAVIPGLNMIDGNTWSMENGLRLKNLSVLLVGVGFLLNFFILRFLYDVDNKKEKELPVLLGRAAKSDSIILDEMAPGIGRQE